MWEGKGLPQKSREVEAAALALVGELLGAEIRRMRSRRGRQCGSSRLPAEGGSRMKGLMFRPEMAKFRLGARTRREMGNL